MSKESRLVGQVSIGPLQLRDLSPSDAAKMDLLELGEAGYRIFRPSDLDWRHEPWLVASDDGSVWTLEPGMPLSGYKPHTNAVLMGKANSWAWMTSAAASGTSAPRDFAELERRARKREEDAQRQAAEHERKLVALRKSAVPVTSGHVDPSMRMTLAEAAERIDQAGGKIEIDDGRLVVRLPPGAGNTWTTGPLDAARVLYLAESTVVALLSKREALPDKPVTPAGFVLA